MTNMPKVLIVSHTACTASDSMGSTLASYLWEYPADKIAQFYIKEMTPDIPVCSRYFKVTDQELVQKLRHPLRCTVGGRVMLQTGEDGRILAGNGAVADRKGRFRHRHAAMLL